MEKTWKKSIKTVLSSLLLCLIVTIAMPGIRSEASSKKPTCAKKQTVYLDSWGDGYYEPTSYTRYIFIKNLASNARITNIKSSNKNVFVFDDTEYGGKSIHLGGELEVKPGTKTKITFKVKQNKKTYSLSCIVTFKKSPCAFKSLKIAGK